MSLSRRSLSILSAIRRARTAPRKLTSTIRAAEPWKYPKSLHQGKNEKNGIAEAIPFLSCLTMFSYREAPLGWCFLFGMSRAGLNSLPRPARSALNQEVRQGSCEWLCHSWDAGSESSLVARSKKKHHPSGWCFLFGAGDFAAQNRSPAGG